MGVYLRAISIRVAAQVGAVGKPYNSSTPHVMQLALLTKRERKKNLSELKYCVQYKLVICL